MGAGTLDATADVDEVVSILDENGFAIIEGILTREEAAATRAELTRILAETPEGRNDFEGFKTRRIYALFAKTRAFDGPATHPLILGVLDRVLGHYQLSAPVGIEIHPGETAQVLHTDDGIYPVPRPHAEIVVNTMWALDDFTLENGATHVVPGSHKWTNKRPAADEPTARAVMPAGSVMMFLGSVFHGGGANNSDRPRLGTVIEYAASWVRQQENQVLAVPLETVRTLSPQLQELIGYNIRPPFTGYVNGRDPRRVFGLEQQS
jgi:ectoine hydroxylase-related dioxygenase (phytanoyl-CoA dioxygenase family)